jgi:transglutaminase-like putative cysteine protease
MVFAAPKPPKLLDRDEVVEAAEAVTTEAYPNADDVVVDETIQTVYKEDGTYQTWDDEYIKVLTEKGKRSHQTVSRYFTLPYGTVEVTDLAVIKPDGTAVELDVAANSRVMVNPSQMSANIYNPNSKILRVSVPGLEIGDLLHIRSFRDTVKARVPNTWSDYTVLEYTAPIVRLTLDVKGPKSLPLSNIRLYDAVSNSVTFTESSSRRGHRYRWEVRDVPRMFPEPNMPSLHTVVQRLLISTIPDWETISRWYWELSLPHLEAVTPEMEAKVAELVDGVTGRTEKIERIFTFVSQQIRYMGITTETTAPGYEPHDVSITFGNRYGVCRDKAALLVAMLRMADLPAYPVLIHAGPRKDEEVPQPFFNHAVVAVGNDDGSYTLMDPTDENTTELFPSYLGYMSYLVAHPEGEGLRTSPVVPASQNLLSIDTTGTLGANGHISLSSQLTFSGINDNAYRSHFTRLKPEERRQFFEGHLKRRVAGATLTGLTIAPPNMLDTTQPLVVKLDYEAPDYPIRGEHHTMLAIPWLSDTLGYANYLLGSTGLDERKYPLYTRLTAGVEEAFTVSLDPVAAQHPITPAASTLSAEGLRYGQAFGVTNNQLHASASFAIDSVEFSPEAYLELKQLLKDREYEQRKRVMFADAVAKEPENDIRILADDLTIDITDATHWTSRRKLSKQVITYAGKKDHSELKLSFNPAWETVELKSARVINTDGSVHKVVEDEMNVMDARWVGGAPRYPAERTLVISLPGVEEGSVITTEVLRTISGKPFFSLHKTFQGFDPVDAASVTVSIPTNLALRVSDLTDTDDYDISTVGGTTTHTWRLDPQPAIRPEDDLPPRWSFMPALILSAGDWNTYVDELRVRLSVAMTNQPACEQKARELTADGDDKMEKVLAIRDFVARNIRSAGPWLTALPWEAITPADTTLADGYGNSTDRAIVLAVMLNAVGVESEMLLASSWAPRMESLREALLDTPQRGLFTHLLVKVMDGRRVVYLNETDHYARLGSTPFEGRVALDLEGEPTVIEPPRTMKERSRSDFLLELDDNGDAQLTATRAYYGMAFGATRRLYEELPPEERRRHFMELVASLSQASEPQGGLSTDFSIYPGFRSFTVSIPRYAVRDGKYLYVTLPAGVGDLLRLNTDTRDGAFYRSEPQRTTVRYDLKLPATTRKVHMLPPEIDWQGPDGFGTIRFEQQPTDDPHHVTLTQEVDLHPAVIRPEAYPVLLKLHQQLQHPSTRTVLIELE